MDPEEMIGDWKERTQASRPKMSWCCVRRALGARTLYLCSWGPGMAESSRLARLWYQSFVHPIEQALYIERLQASLDAAASPGIRFEVHGLDPPDHLFHPLTEFRCAAQAIRNALEAERAGYDAFVIGHFQEPGLLEIRGAVDIPVIGLGEANLLAGLGMGYRLGLVTIDPVFVPWHDRQVKMHGLGERVVGTAALKMNLPAFMK